jgi:hypothetical protein
MNRTNLKNYAPQARRDFIQAMTDRAAYFGLTDTKSEPVVVKGDVAVIGGRSFPIAVAKKRKVLEDSIKQHGFEQTMEAMAYTWFNRLVAIRFMELHGYLEHGYRVLSHPEGKPTPEILEHAEHIEMPGLKKEAVIDLKLAGNKEGELYRLLLTAQCNALHTAMPFLFEKIEDETELLLPDNLLNSDSLMRKLVGQIEEEDWNEVEIIGWMYQFYISEKKDEVIGKVVASEDIPAATQLFTPNWIVKYLVQNTLGRQWLEHHPESPLKAKMEYYIEPAEQTSEVHAQLQQVIEARTKANRGLTADCPLPSADFSLNPEELTLLDPACGSGHILVEAYDLFKAIYQERGYRAKDIPALILQKNLFGMEIDDRAAQLAALALMMKARADDRRIFDSEAKPNILAFEDSQGMKASEIHFALTSPLKGEKEGELESPVPDGYLFEPDDNLFTRAEDEKAAASRTPTTVNFSQADIASLLELFENAKTFGSLIQVPPKLAAKLPEIEKRLDDVLTNGDLTHASAHILKPLIRQTWMLSQRFDAVVANPPYMTSDYMPPSLKALIATRQKNKRTDLYAVFLQRAIPFVKAHGAVSMITRDSWFFLPTFEKMRLALLASTSFISAVHLGPKAFEMIGGHVVQTVMFTLIPHRLADHTAVFHRLVEGTHEEKQASFLERHNKHELSQEIFESIEGSPIAYWLLPATRNAFGKCKQLSDVAEVREGIHTGDNERFIRFWWEVANTLFSTNETSDASIDAQAKKWIPYNKGGKIRKWYGNNELVIAFDSKTRDEMRTLEGHVRYNQHLYYKEGATWTDVGSGFFCVRYYPDGFLFDGKGMAVVGDDLWLLLGLLNSSPCQHFANILMPTLNFKCGSVKKLPYIEPESAQTVRELAKSAVKLSKASWDSSEISWDFQLPSTYNSQPTVCESLQKSHKEANERVASLRDLEENNNDIFIHAFGLRGELSLQVPDEQITIYLHDREEDIKRLLSYALGCIMGRYSLDRPGLIYAHSGNQGFDPSQYKTFRSDDDGIIPLLETDWGIRDDAANRIVEFVGVAWPKEHLEENLKFVADSLGPTGSEQPRETIRRYLANGFYKHHLSMYKKRPIYWLFSSGKQRAFQCLVYLHRYHEGTLARMRTEYVIPLQGQIAARIEQLEGDKSKATSTSHRKKLQKEQDYLKKQQTELLTFEEKLKHAADQKIGFDLDDGVKVNYAKFGDLLADSKAITGGKEEE